MECSAGSCGSGLPAIKSANCFACIQNIKQLCFRQSSRPKIVTILFTKSFRFEKGEPPMRIKHAMLVGSMAALASLTAPALAKHSDAPKANEQPTSSPCSAYARAADGTWTQLPFQQLGSCSIGPPREGAPGL